MYRNAEAPLREREQELKDEERRLHDELRALEEIAPRTSILDDVRVASPCTARWEDMDGDERERFCGACEKQVYDISELTRAEAELFLTTRLAGGVCIRIHQRADGTILTRDCSVGASRVRRRRLVLALFGSGAAAAAAWVTFHSTACDPAPCRVTTGVGGQAGATTAAQSPYSTGR